MTGRHIVALLLVVFLIGCAKGDGLTKQDIFKQYETIGQLSREILAAQEDGAELLASRGIAAAKEFFQAAMEQAIAGDKGDALEEADAGLAKMEVVRATLVKAKELMATVLSTRSRAEDEGAPTMFAEPFAELDDELREATIYIEEGNLSRAMESRPKLQAKYSALELKALKKGTVELAKAAIEHAEKTRAGKYAPKTLKLAQEEIKLVISVLEADRTQTDKAVAHAQKTIWLAGRAEAITEIAKMIEYKDFSNEELVLWYHKQLETAYGPLGGELPFDRKNDEMIEAFRASAESVVKGMEDARNMMNASHARVELLVATSVKQKAESDAIISELLGASRKELAKLKRKYANRMSKDGAKQAKKEQADLEFDSLFSEVKKSFDKDTEAVVSRDEGNVLISAHGFHFSTGGTELEARNFGLLNKVVSAIQLFPDSRVVVTGHTDSKGNAKKNLRLSKDRAENVVNFMSELAKVPKSRLEYDGHGEKKPVTSNDTKAGRARNRRIEFFIVNN